MNETVYINAKNLVLGRLSSSLVPHLLAGRNVIVVNAEQAVVTGSRKFVLSKYLNARARRTLTNPRRGPFFPRFPDRIIRRTVRGMLPYKTPSGKDAFKRLTVYISTPEELKSQTFETIDSAQFRNKSEFLTLKELSRELGWRYAL